MYLHSLDELKKFDKIIYFEFDLFSSTIDTLNIFSDEYEDEIMYLQSNLEEVDIDHREIQYFGGLSPSKFNIEEKEYILTRN